MSKNLGVKKRSFAKIIVSNENKFEEGSMILTDTVKERRKGDETSCDTYDSVSFTENLVAFNVKSGKAAAPRESLHGIFLLNFPVAFLGLALGCTGLAKAWNFLLKFMLFNENLIFSIEGFLDVIALTILCCYGLKIFFYPRACAKEVDSIDVHATLCAGSMALSNISSCLHKYFSGLCLTFWYVSLVTHLFLVISHLSLRLRHFRAMKILGASYWPSISPTLPLPFVGMSVLSINSQYFGEEVRAIGECIFWCALANCLIINSLNFYRMFFVEFDSVKPLKFPTFFIITAPSALIFNAYHCIGATSQEMTVFLFSMQLTMLGFFLVFVVKRVKTRPSFSPAWSALTFPSSINAAGFAVFAVEMGNNKPLLGFSVILLLISTIILVYVLMKSANWYHLSSKAHEASFIEEEQEKVGKC